MRVRHGELLLPLVYTNLVLITLPMMYSQLIVATQGLRNGMSCLQIATLFCNGPVLLSFLGSYCKGRAENHTMVSLLCKTTILLALLTTLLAFIPLSGGAGSYLLLLSTLSLISLCCFFSQLACYAIISTYTVSYIPGITVIDTTHAVSAAMGMFICYYFVPIFGHSGLFFISAALIVTPPLLLWAICIEDSPFPKMFVKEDTLNLSKHNIDKVYLEDERLKNDLSKASPYLMMEHERFGMSLIDTDAQVIIIMNITYVVTVAISQGVSCIFLVSLSQRSRVFTMDKCCFLYSASVVLSTAICAIVRPLVVKQGILTKVLTLLYLAVSNVFSLFLLSDLDSYVGKCILAYCCIVANCQLLEEVIDTIITNYYDNLALPAMKSFPVRDYINSKIGFLHGFGALFGSLVFGLIANDMETESVLFTVAALFATLTVVTTPLSILFVATDLR